MAEPTTTEAQTTIYNCVEDCVHRIMRLMNRTDNTEVNSIVRNYVRCAVSDVAREVGILCMNGDLVLGVED